MLDARQAIAVMREEVSAVARAVRVKAFAREAWTIPTGRWPRTTGAVLATRWTECRTICRYRGRRGSAQPVYSYTGRLVTLSGPIRGANAPKSIVT